MTCSELYCLVHHLLNITCIYITSVLLSLSLSHTHTHKGHTWVGPGPSENQGKSVQVAKWQTSRELVFVGNPGAHGDPRVTLWWLTFPQLCVSQNEALHQRQASINLLHGQHAEQAPQAVWNNNSRSESHVIHNSNTARVSHTHDTKATQPEWITHTHTHMTITNTARVSHTHTHTHMTITNTARVSHTHTHTHTWQ